MLALPDITGSKGRIRKRVCAEVLKAENYKMLLLDCLDILALKLIIDLYFVPNSHIIDLPFQLI